jgi:hypothetical protein
VVAAVAVGAVAMVVRGAGDSRIAEATDPVATKTPKPAGTATPRATPRPAPTAPAVLASDVCHPILDVACRLGAARYAPTGLTPAVAFTLGDGWSASVAGNDLVVMTRPEGALTVATNVGSPDGDKRFKDGSAKQLIAGIARSKGTKATKPASLRIDGRTGRSVDVTSRVADPIAVFAAGGRTYYLEPGRTTRFVALDDPGGTLLLVIEPSDGHTLRDILETADIVAGTLAYE